VVARAYTRNSDPKSGKLEFDQNSDAGDVTTAGQIAGPDGGLTYETVTTAGSGIVFNNTFDVSVSGTVRNLIVAAEHEIASVWSNSITLNLEFFDQAAGSTDFLATNSWPSWVTVSYPQLVSALSSHAYTVYAQDAIATLTSDDPTGSHTYYLPEAYARMLGLSTSNPTYDDVVTLNTSYNWSYSQDVTNTLVHEISEGAMGRVGGLGDQNGVWSTLDLFRFSSAGARDVTDGRDNLTTYFSYNGTTLLLPYNNQYSGSTHVNTGDTADFNVQDVFGYGSPGETNTLSQADLEVMDVLGWDPIASVYDFYFVYADGSYYYGTVADNGSYGYYTGEKINGTYGGYYYIYGTGGSTSQAVGTVNDYYFYSSKTGQAYTPYYSQYYGHSLGSGLNGDYDYVYANGSYQLFGYGGAYEPSGSKTTLYDFYYVYADGSYYYGTVADNGSYGYHTGESIRGTYGGYYYIYGTGGSTSQAAGTVNDYYFYSSKTGQAYTPYYSQNDGHSLGSGLNGDYDYVYANGSYQLFGYGGYYEPKGATTLYDFYFVYADGSYYYGTVADNGSYRYYTGEKINGTYGGYYYIYGTGGSTSQAVGTVNDYYFYSSQTGQAYTPYYSQYYGHSLGSGLNGDYDYVYASGHYQIFGYGGAYKPSGA
jgi:hypothetical protein